MGDDLDGFDLEGAGRRPDEAVAVEDVDEEIVGADLGQLPVRLEGVNGGPAELIFVGLRVYAIRYNTVPMGLRTTASLAMTYIAPDCGIEDGRVEPATNFLVVGPVGLLAFRALMHGVSVRTECLKPLWDKW